MREEKTKRTSRMNKNKTRDKIPNKMAILYKQIAFLKILKIQYNKGKK